MRIMVMGAGAIGSLFGGYLSKAGNEILLVGRKKHIQAIGKKGLVVKNKTEFIVKPKAIDSIERVNGFFDLILITVKAYDTKQAVYDVRKLISDKTTLMLLQNGLGVEDTVFDIVEKPLRAVTMNGALLSEPGLVTHTGAGDTIIGELSGNITQRLKILSNTMTKAGLNTRITRDIGSVVWIKTLINSGINPLGALTGMKNGELLNVPSLKRLIVETIKEGMCVAEKNGVNLEDDPIALAIKTAKLTKNNKNSMLQDIMNKKRTEIDFINGAISKYGRTKHVKTPINDVLVGLINALEYQNLRK